MSYLDLTKIREERDAQRRAAEQAATEMLRDLIGCDHSDTAHRVATEHLLSFHQLRCWTEHPTPT